MLKVLSSTWPLFFGLLLLMIGNGLQGTLLGVRGADEGYSPTIMSIVMAAYFGGLLAGAWTVHALIRHVGHVRVFAAFASLISAAFLLYAALPNPLVWIAMRFVVGYGFAGIYVVTESWLNEGTDNANRGQALSLYYITLNVGIISAQLFLNLADPSAYALYILISVLVSVAVAPILLSASPAPVFNNTTRMTLADLYRVSPLGVVGSFLLGGIVSAMFGMSAVYAGETGLDKVQISIFLALIFTGGLLLQYPLGWISDRIDRRKLILGVTATGAAVIFVLTPFSQSFAAICVMGFTLGGVSFPLYALLLAYTNDFLQREQMASASAGLMFVNGLSAVMGPILLGVLMSAIAPWAFFTFNGVLMAAIAGYAAWRMTRRAAPEVDDTQSYAPILPQGSAVGLDVWQEDYVTDDPATAAEDEAEALAAGRAAQ